jgi:uncharacterized membrane protein AbrB (regulator of aidB expression)
MSKRHRYFIVMLLAFLTSPIAAYFDLIGLAWICGFYAGGSLVGFAREIDKEHQHDK